MAIRAVGDKITVTVNEDQVCDANLDQLQSEISGRFQFRQPGPIGLQWMSGAARFRKLRIRQLDAEGKVIPADSGVLKNTNPFIKS